MAEEETKTENEVATVSEETEAIDSKTLMAGCLVGKKISAMRGKV